MVIGPHAALLCQIQKLTTVEYSAEATASGIQGSAHVVAVTATNDIGISATKSVTIFVGVGPLNTTFSGTSTVKTTYSRAPGPFFDSVSIGLQFSSDRKIVTVTSLAPIVSTTSPQQDVTVTVTVTLSSGGVGTFDPSTGTMTLPITLAFQVAVYVSGVQVHNGTSTLALVLSTGKETSPSGAFTDTGVPMQADGSITVVGDGMFSGDVLAGSDASVVLSGVVSPHP
jgi:hypothetical protein